MRIHVYPAAAARRLPRLLEALARAFPVQFFPVDSLEATREGVSLIFPGTLDHPIPHTGLGGASRYIVECDNGADDSVLVPCGDQEVTLGSIPGIHLNLSHFTLRDSQLTSHRLPSLPSDYQVAAQTETGPIWSWKRAAHQLEYRVSQMPEELGANELLRDHLRPGKCVRLLPLIHFLRQLTETDGFEFPKCLACVALDDPNLHWTSYGFVRFQDLARHAREANYHVAVATVPLDSWWTHSGTADIFRNHSGRLSLMMHGNDHTYMELGRASDKANFQHLMAQALRRMDRLEAKSGVRVARVMEPPHGVCSYESAQVLGNLGFASALLTHDRVLECDLRHGWSDSFGLLSLDMVGSHFPLIARSRWSQDWLHNIPLSVILQQPLVVATHHEDAEGNYINFGRIADSINRLGPVHWCGFTEMAASLYQVRTHGETLAVRPWNRRIRVQRPPGIRSLHLESRHPGAHWSYSTGPTNSASPSGSQVVPASGLVPFGMEDHIWIELDAPPPVDYRNQPTPKSSPWPLVRRFLSTTRDRSRAIIPFDPQIVNRDSPSPRIST